MPFRSGTIPEETAANSVINIFCEFFLVNDYVLVKIFDVVIVSDGTLLLANFTS